MRGDNIPGASRAVIDRPEEFIEVACARYSDRCINWTFSRYAVSHPSQTHQSSLGFREIHDTSMAAVHPDSCIGVARSVGMGEPWYGDKLRASGSASIARQWSDDEEKMTWMTSGRVSGGAVRLSARGRWPRPDVTAQGRRCITRRRRRLTILRDSINIISSYKSGIGQGPA